MDWPRLLAYITGTVDQELLLRNEYLAAENLILRGQIKGRLHVNSRYPVSHCSLLGGKRRACRKLHIQSHVAVAAPARGRQQRPFIRSITHAPGQTGSQPQQLHCVFDLAALACSPLCFGSQRFSSSFAGRRP